MSTFVSYSNFLIISGAMYNGDPSVSVKPPSYGSKHLEKPKSVILTCIVLKSFEVKRMFSGFMSL